MSTTQTEVTSDDTELSVEERLDRLEGAIAELTALVIDDSLGDVDTDRSVEQYGEALEERLSADDDDDVDAGEGVIE